MMSIPALDNALTIAPGSLSFMKPLLSQFRNSRIPPPGNREGDEASRADEPGNTCYFKTLSGTNPVDATILWPSSLSMKLRNFMISPAGHPLVNM